MRNLEAAVIDMDLRNPECRRIVNAYRQASTVRLNELVFIPLVREHPELQETCSVLVDESSKDYVATRDMAMMKTIAMVNVMGPGLLAPEIPGLEGGEKVVERIYEILSLTTNCFRLSDEFYWKVAKSAAALAPGNADNFVRSVEGRDRISVDIFPCRSDAENYNSVCMRLMRKMSSQSSKLLGIMGEEYARDNPINPRRYGILDEAVARFIAAEFDRIYRSS